MQLVAVIFLSLFITSLASAQELPSGATAGQILFHSYCASCHGIRADGNGPVAPQLTVPPPDLTRLAERRGLPLPKEEIAAYIDGRTDVAAHGPREMPVWGEKFFSGDPALNPNQEAARRRTIQVILEYLESVQQRRESRLETVRGG